MYSPTSPRFDDGGDLPVAYSPTSPCYDYDDSDIPYSPTSPRWDGGAPNAAYSPTSPRYDGDDADYAPDGYNGSLHDVDAPIPPKDFISLFAKKIVADRVVERPVPAPAPIPSSITFWGPTDTTTLDARVQRRRPFALNSAFGLTDSSKNTSHRA